MGSCVSAPKSTPRPPLNQLQIKILPCSDTQKTSPSRAISALPSSVIIQQDILPEDIDADQYQLEMERRNSMSTIIRFSKKTLDRNSQEEPPLIQIDTDQCQLEEDRKNSQSKIIKFNKKTKKAQPQQQPIETPPKKARDDVLSCQQILSWSKMAVENMSGKLQQSKNKEYVLRITNQMMQMQFLLPRCRAGPIVVPYINYQDYYT